MERVNSLERSAHYHENVKFFFNYVVFCSKPLLRAGAYFRQVVIKKNKYFYFPVDPNPSCCNDFGILLSSMISDVLIFSTSNCAIRSVAFTLKSLSE